MNPTWNTRTTGNTMHPVIALTPGEPAGIGPDITLAIAQQNLPAGLVCYADPDLLQERCNLLGYQLEIIPVSDLSQLQPHQAGQLHVYPVALKQSVQPGKLNKANAAYVLDTLSTAVAHIKNKSVHALVTGPVHKGIINESGIQFSGHTEFLAELTQGDPVMMLCTETLRVALATTHLPLNQVSPAITQQSLEKVITILHTDLVNKFGINHPRILVCGLNPHAGEDGHLGTEELTVIQPVLNKLRKKNLRLTGPLPADTLFTP
ncbi:MAG: 4-hydroxythreonine-4-phosphate dehydrogenase PdxA, partial [Gammaproteobacteria bacterium]|nr:4-hydroxythreonine-4-phosphate dehydrogenase PdxA [Gammaproteobacteria bacterium]